MTLTFEIPGKPNPLKRHRVARGRGYDPVENKHNKAAVATFARTAMASQKWVKAAKDVPLRVACGFYVNQLKSRTLPAPTFQKSGDVDNLAKLILDALNDVAYHDDSQVVHLTTTKQFTIHEPKTIVRIEVAV